VKRREFITLLGGAAAWPLAASAQQPARPVIGYLNSRARGDSVTALAAFHRGLKEAGYIEGHNVAIEYRWAEGHYDRLRVLAADLVHRQVTVITATTNPATLAAKAATAIVPVVFFTGDDPVTTGLVASLNRPGGNLTGVTTLNVEIGPKRLELLHELVPGATTFALLVNPGNPFSETLSRDAEAAARALGLQLHVLQASTEGELNTAFASLVHLRAGALFIGNDAFFASRSEQLAALALRYAVPTIFAYHEFAAAGGLMSYGSNLKRSLSSDRRLHRPNTRRREAGRPAGLASHESRTHSQPQDRQGTRTDHSVAAPGPRR